jgi:hypothetical protein
VVDWNAEQTPHGGTESVTRYEELRARALGACDGLSAGLGWTLFVRKGMASWLRAWQDYRPPGETEPHALYKPFTETDQGHQREIVMTWTGMILGQLPRIVAWAP